MSGMAYLRISWVPPFPLQSDLVVDLLFTPVKQNLGALPWESRVGKIAYFQLYHIDYDFRSLHAVVFTAAGLVPIDALFCKVLHLQSATCVRIRTNLGGPKRLWLHQSSSSL